MFEVLGRTLTEIVASERAIIVLGALLAGVIVFLVVAGVRLPRLRRGGHALSPPQGGDRDGGREAEPAAASRSDGAAGAGAREAGLADQEAAALAGRLMAAAPEFGIADELRVQICMAIEDLRALKAAGHEAPRLEEALAGLEGGDTRAAERVLRDIHDAQVADGERGREQAAIAARHLGALALLRDTASAFAAYESAVTLHPRDAGAWAILGALQARRGQVERARAALQHAIALAERLGEAGPAAAAQLQLGLLFRDAGEEERATHCLRQALQLSSRLERKETMAECYDSLGLTHLVGARYALAQECFETALRLERELGREPGAANALGNLGIIRMMQGDRHGACVRWRAAREMFRSAGQEGQVAQIEALMAKAGCSGSDEESAGSAR